jgi:hypothetical protein
VEIHGGGLDTNFVAALKNGSETITVSDYTYIAGKGTIKISFNLRGKTLGIYDFVLEKAGGPVYNFSDGFKIVAGTKPDPWVSITGRNRMLFNTWTTYSVNYGNYGNVDAVMTPLWLVFTRNPGLDIELSGLEFIDTLDGEPVPAEIVAFDQEMILGIPKQVRVYSVVIPNIAANSVNSFSIKVKSSEDIEILAWAASPLFQSPWKPLISECIKKSFKYLDNKEFMRLSDLECFLWKFESYFEEFLYKEQFRLIKANKRLVLSFVSAMVYAMSDCRIDYKNKENIITFSAALWINNNVINRSGLRKASENDSSLNVCSTEFAPNHLQTTSVRTVSSLDPNEKTGLYGFGPANYVMGAMDLPYSIFFENLSTATAPAHVVTITDQLDANKFDLSSFRFGNIRIGDSLIVIPPGLKSIVVNKLFASRNTLARITGEMDTITGMVAWKFRSLDPFTLADMEDPDMGLLPPNLVPPEGEGSVSFHVRLKNTPQHGEPIANEAAIVFDSNPAIQTNRHTLIFDLIAPESKVLPIAATSASRDLDVTWSGSDQGSGIQAYNIYVSAGDGPYLLWMGGTSQTSATFRSPSDNLYHFISVASDHVGNRESIPEVPDASVSVITDIKTRPAGEEVVIYPVPAGNEVTFGLTKAGNYQLALYSLDGRLVHKLSFYGPGYCRINTSNLVNGLYVWRIVSESGGKIQNGKLELHH